MKSQDYQGIVEQNVLPSVKAWSQSQDNGPKHSWNKTLACSRWTFYESWSKSHWPPVKRPGWGTLQTWAGDKIQIQDRYWIQWFVFREISLKCLNHNLKVFDFPQGPLSSGTTSAGPPVQPDQIQNSSFGMNSTFKRLNLHLMHFGNHGWNIWLHPHSDLSNQDFWQFQHKSSEFYFYRLNVLLH